MELNCIIGPSEHAWEKNSISACCCLLTHFKASKDLHFVLMALEMLQFLLHHCMRIKNRRAVLTQLKLQLSYLSSYQYSYSHRISFTSQPHAQDYHRICERNCGHILGKGITSPQHETATAQLLMMGKALLVL